MFKVVVTDLATPVTLEAAAVEITMTTTTVTVSATMIAIVAAIFGQRRPNP